MPDNCYLQNKNYNDTEYEQRSALLKALNVMERASSDQDWLTNWLSNYIIRKGSPAVG